MKNLTIFIISLGSLVLTGCGDQTSSTLGGAAIGTIAGAAIGNAIDTGGGTALGAVIGGLAGAAIGSNAGHEEEMRQQQACEAQRQYVYAEPRQARVYRYETYRRQPRREYEYRRETYDPVHGGYYEESYTEHY